MKLPSKPPIYADSSSLQLWLQTRAAAIQPNHAMLYKMRANHWEDDQSSAKASRHLDASFDIAPSKRLLDKQSEDTTEKLLLQMGDGSLVETVVIRAPQIGVGLNKSRKTICISTQVGCAYGCKFCASGLSGWKRDLNPGEIVSQLIQVCQQEDTSTPRNDQSIAPFDIAVMGMGEPLANYENLLEVYGSLNALWASILELVASPFLPQNCA